MKHQGRDKLNQYLFHGKDDKNKNVQSEKVKIKMSFKQKTKLPLLGSVFDMYLLIQKIQNMRITYFSRTLLNSSALHKY